MPLLKTRGLVLRAYDYGDSSRIFRVYTRDAGAQSLLARGVKGSRSRLRGVLDLFNLVDVSFYRKAGRSLHVPREADLVESHAVLKRDLGRMLGFGAVVRLLQALALEEEANPEMFDLLIDTAAAFDRADLAAEAIEPLRHYASWQVLARKGYAPEVDCCVACGSEAGGSPGFAVAEGGVVCGRCDARGRPLSRREYGALQLFLHGDGGLAAAWRFDGGEGRRLDRIREEFAVYHAGLPPRFLAGPPYAGMLR
ncbi:MAG: DNA repair protein RecO [Gemmatimonadetes bacterium]|nr:DNA repair protein RecO [Gemmatimonadota bacterium]